MNQSPYKCFATGMTQSSALCLVSYEGQLKCLLLPYKWLIQPYFSVLWLKLVTHFNTRAMLMDDINDKWN